jgi:3-oxoacyl-[acyl-carrier protein] reductase
MSGFQTHAAELNFNDISVGQHYEFERHITKQDVERFAALSGDFNPLHLDSTYAASTEFGSCIVHGMLLASLFSQLVGMYIPGRHALYLGQDLSFRKPVMVGETVQVLARVTTKIEATKTIVLTTEIRNADGFVAVTGTAKVKCRGLVSREFAESRTADISARPVSKRIALVTGASRGIGAEIARVLAARGIAVAVNYLRNGDLAHELVQDIRQQKGEAIAVQGDIRSGTDVERIFASISKELGDVSFVVNGAGGELLNMPLVEIAWSALEAQLEYQVKAVLQVCKAAYPKLKACHGGAIVNVLSQVTAGQPPARMGDYVTAKYALMGLSKALAVEWAGDGIRVNMVSPGLVQTDLTQHYPDRVFNLEANRTPLRRIAKPSDVAGAVAFLLSEDAAFLTGVNLIVSGGLVMS